MPFADHYSNPLMVAWLAYGAALEEHPFAVDTFTTAAIYSLSDTFAQQIARSRGEQGGVDSSRVLRYSTFGAMDGFFSHIWFEKLDAFIPGSSALVTAEKLVADSLLLNPVWCGAYIIVMALLEGAGPRGALRRMQTDYFSLFTSSYVAWIPFNIFIYGVLPLQYRVAGLATATLLYTVFLSYWSNSGAAGQRGGVAEKEEGGHTLGGGGTRAPGLGLPEPAQLLREEVLGVESVQDVARGPVELDPADSAR